jgi:Copper amine oxidase, enzyme domain
MTRRWGGVVLLALASLGAATAAGAQPVGPTCSLTGEHLMSWPTDNPVWQFCWVRPQQSSGTNGSGLEIRNVYYNGHLVMKRGHVPMLNVDYDPGGCGCYRDWQNQEVVFHANNPVSSGYAEPTVPPLTVCDTGGSNGDCGPPDTDCFLGVAAEKLADRLILTTQFEAGWYRYTMKWRFYLDGRIEPAFGFSAIDASCVYHSHRHHAYWRLDFDIDGPANDLVTEGPNPAPGGGGHGGNGFPIVNLLTETKRVNNRPGMTWSVIDSVTHRGYRIVPGPEVDLPVDTFSIGDFWALKYKANEIDDGGNIGDCPVDFSAFLNGEVTSGDVVVWYRTGWFHPPNQLDDCDLGGPTIYPIGDWSPTP